MILEFLTLLSLFIIAYAYFLYPLILWCCKKTRLTPLAIRRAVPNGSQSGDCLPRLAIIIAVRNEEKVIARKVSETLALPYGEKSVAEHLQASISSGVESKVLLIVASDNSTDRTEAIVREFAPQGVALVSIAERGGKEAAQKAAVLTFKEKFSASDLVLFTDAKVSLNDEALNNLVKYFRDPSVGAVSSADRVYSSNKESGEGMYVRYEMWLRSLESEFNSLVGLSGSCFAVRCDVAACLRANVSSDFVLLLETQRLGFRGVSASDVIGSYQTVSSESEEFARKVRTVLRGITSCFSTLELLNPRKYGVFAWQMWSHKIARWLVPWMILSAYFGAFCRMENSWLFALVFCGMSAVFALALIALCQPRFRRLLGFRVPLFFMLVNAAIALAWLKFLRGERISAWTPSDKRP